jgi:hypothetical protein
VTETAQKAWGIQCRPKVQLSEEDDDYEWLADDELGNAPLDPETYEGGHGKPDNNQVESINKWCARQCERSIVWDRADAPPVLPDFSKRIKNMDEQCTS